MENQWEKSHETCPGKITPQNQKKKKKILIIEQHFNFITIKKKIKNKENEAFFVFLSDFGAKYDQDKFLAGFMRS